jgi:hypothetical protein
VGSPEIERELEQILASPFFKGSKRSQAFLKYVVEAACSEGSDGLKERTLGIALFGRAPDYDTGSDGLKERTLGIALFGRAPDYDTGSDAIVRVKANEVRKRLSQYNLANPKNAVVITLETGSYLPQIIRNAGQEEPPAQTTVPGNRFAAVRTAAALFAVVFLIAVVTLYQISLSSPIKKFWSPFLDHGSTIICIASPPVYVTNRTTLPAVGSFAWGHETVHQADLVVTPDSFLDVGDASAAFHIEELLQTLGRRSHVDIPDNVSFAELKEAPVVLIGGPQYNSWTRTMVTNDLPFVFVQDDQGVRIVDREHPARFWGDPGVLPIDVTEDFALITRILRSTSGQAVICVAGIQGSGSQMGAEAITNADYLQSILKHAPHDWEHKNVQFILKTKIVGGIPGAPELVASAYR